MHGTHMEPKKMVATGMPRGTKGPKEGHPNTPTNMATHELDGANARFPGDIAGAVSKPANDKNLYQEGNMALSAPDLRHRPDSAVSNMLPGGTTQSGETGGI